MALPNQNIKEKEIKILREAIDKAENIAANKLAQSEETKNIIKIVEEFIIDKKLICYGGTAINNILPKDKRFYDPNTDVPDYDFFSTNAMEDAKQLAKIYAKKKYTNVEAKAGLHKGTYKVFVNFIPIADITQIPKKLFEQLSKKAIKRDHILYAPANYLRMAMYLELSRPFGDISRWEKVLKRLTLINEIFPIKNPDCDNINFIRKFENDNLNSKKIFNYLRRFFIDEGVVFFGGYASFLYSRYMPKYLQDGFNKYTPDFDVLSENAKQTAIKLKEELIKKGYKDVKYIKNKKLGEIIPVHYEIVIEKDTVAFIYQTLACHNYNTININKHKIKIATIDTILSFYLAFLFSDNDYYNKDRIFCLAQYLFSVQIKNRLKQKGLLKRFTLNCYGEQPTLQSIRQKKTDLYNKLKHNKKSLQYKRNFLKYIPPHNTQKIKPKQKKTKRKHKRKHRKTKHKK